MPYSKRDRWAGIELIYNDETVNTQPSTTLEEIYDNLGFLQNLDLVEIAKEEDVTEVSITEKGVEYGSLNHDERLRRIYSEYPEFAEQSLVRGRYR